MVGSKRASIRATRMFFLPVSSASAANNADWRSSRPKALIMRILVRLSWVRSLRLENAACASLKRSCKASPLRLIMIAITGIGNRANKVNCQLICVDIIINTAQPITSESTSVSTPSPAANTTRSTSLVARAMRSPVR
ncbi:Uncharacterised protein [Shigella flexneri]|nr:Uncharacterised protein [Shigella flexneri]